LAAVLVHPKWKLTLSSTLYLFGPTCFGSWPVNFVWYRHKRKSWRFVKKSYHEIRASNNCDNLHKRAIRRLPQHFPAPVSSLLLYFPPSAPGLDQLFVCAPNGIKAESKDEQILTAVLATDAHFSLSYIIDLCGGFPSSPVAQQPLSGQCCVSSFPVFFFNMGEFFLLLSLIRVINLNCYFTLKAPQKDLRSSWHLLTTPSPYFLCGSVSIFMLITSHSSSLVLPLPTSFQFTTICVFKLPLPRFSLPKLNLISIRLLLSHIY